MLEFDVDLESGLGIDSIKRVEIFGALSEQHEIKGLDAQKMEELSTVSGSLSDLR